MLYERTDAAPWKGRDDHQAGSFDALPANWLPEAELSKWRTRSASPFGSWTPVMGSNQSVAHRWKSGDAWRQDMVLARLSKMALDLILVSAAVLALVLAMPMSFWNGIDPAIASLASLGIATMAVGFVASRSIRREGKAASLRLQELDESDNQGLQAVSTTPSFVTVIDSSSAALRTSQNRFDCASNLSLSSDRSMVERKETVTSIDLSP